ncbi:MAG: DUF1934 family protein [Clostridia bacterium]|nr:DUF1934 family protein [Clostridia bacterium]
MKKCHLSIVSSVDGNENTFSYAASYKRSAFSGVLCYEENGARVEMRFEKGAILIRREGDYGLNVVLKEGERTEGLLFVAGASGAVQVETTRAKYSLTETSVLASLKYRLIFQAETQEMSLRIKASCVNSEES